MAERNATDPLRALPGELQNEIFTHLDYPAAISLASTNRYFRRVVNPLTQVSDEDKLVFLRYAQCFLKQNKYKPACFTCFRVKERYHFPAQSAVHNVHVFSEGTLVTLAFRTPAAGTRSWMAPIFGLLESFDK
ncbi:hypothetical protein BKA80DRAFT_298199 [Phyllosticta citrichinensis]